MQWLDSAGKPELPPDSEAWWRCGNDEAPGTAEVTVESNERSSHMEEQDSDDTLPYPHEEEDESTNPPEQKQDVLWSSGSTESLHSFDGLAEALKDVGLSDLQTTEDLKKFLISAKNCKEVFEANGAKGEDLSESSKKEFQLQLKLLNEVIQLLRTHGANNLLQEPGLSDLISTHEELRKDFEDCGFPHGFPKSFLHNYKEVRQVFKDLSLVSLLDDADAARGFFQSHTSAQQELTDLRAKAQRLVEVEARLKSREEDLVRSKADSNIFRVKLLACDDERMKLSQRFEEVEATQKETEEELARSKMEVKNFQSKLLACEDERASLQERLKEMEALQKQTEEKLAHIKGENKNHSWTLKAIQQQLWNLADDSEEERSGNKEWSDNWQEASYQAASAPSDGQHGMHEWATEVPRGPQHRLLQLPVVNVLDQQGTLVDQLRRYGAVFLAPGWDTKWFTPNWRRWNGLMWEATRDKAKFNSRECVHGHHLRLSHSEDLSRTMMGEDKPHQADRRVAFGVSDSSVRNVGLNWEDLSWIVEEYNSLKTSLRDLVRREFHSLCDGEMGDRERLGVKMSRDWESWSKTNLRHCVYPDNGTCTSHTDYGFLTLQYTTAPGLQVLHQDEWYELDQPRDYALLMAGDSLEILTNGTLKAVQHRVTMPESEGNYARFDSRTMQGVRQSHIIFLAPHHDTLVAPLKRFLREDGTDFEPVRYGEWHTKKVNLAFERRWT